MNSFNVAVNDLPGHNSIFPEHTPVSSVPRSCPYFAFFQPLRPSSTNSNEHVANGPNFNHLWSAASGPNEIPFSHQFPAGDHHYQVLDHHSPPFSATNSHVGAADQGSVPSDVITPSRGDSDGPPRSETVVHVDQG